MKTEPSTSSTTPPVLPKRGEPEINPPPSVRGNLAWGVHWPWHKALAVANRIWWYNPLRHTTWYIYMIYVYIWVVHSFCLFCCLFIIVTTQFVALYEPCKPKPKPKPSTYDTRTTTPWQRSKFRYLDRSQSNKYAINMQIQTISVSK